MSAVSIRTVVVLPAPFGPEQAEDLAAAHLEVHPADRPQVAERAGPDRSRRIMTGSGAAIATQSDRACGTIVLVTRPWTSPR